MSTPPSSTPTAPPPDITKPKKPIAFARSAGSENSPMISDSATAETAAPPRPWTARPATSSSALGASPQATEATVNDTRPAWKTRLLPNRSPSRPDSSRKPPKVSRYALTTHASADCVKPRSDWMDGRATFTMLWSSTIIRSPRQRT